MLSHVIKLPPKGWYLAFVTLFQWRIWNEFSSFQTVPLYSLKLIGAFLPLVQQSRLAVWCWLLKGLRNLQ